MQRLSSILLILLLVAPRGHAGPWPREKGRGFVAAATRVAASDIAGPYLHYSTTYIEYGLRRDVTLGFDFGRGVSGREKAVLFLRYPLAISNDTHRFAAEIGAGIIAGQPSIRPGLSYGRGFSGKRLSGWFTIDSVAEVRLDTGRADLKADITLGLNLSSRMKSIFQVQTGISGSDPSFIRLAPSLVLRTGPRSHAEIGLTSGLSGDSQVGIKVGFWREF